MRIIKRNWPHNCSIPVIIANEVWIADKHNSYKPEQDQIFHTKTKGFVVLHPTSVFTYRPDLLELPDTPETETSSNEVLIGGHRSRTSPVSSKHQLIAYVSLLETVKPYLVGAMRVPALQTLLFHYGRPPIGARPLAPAKVLHVKKPKGKP